MDALFLIWAKFAAELVYLQVGLVSLLSSYFLYSWVIRRNGLRRTDMLPAAVVKEHLDKIATEERIMRQRLFGEGAVAPSVVAQHAPLVGDASAAAVASADPALIKELQAVRAQLSAADQRSAEFDKRIAGLQAEKAELEKKLSTAAATPAAAGAAGAANPALEKELSDLRAKLSEYEVIEDDLANLKKYQLENKALLEKIAQFDKSVAAAPAAAPAPVAAPIAAVVAPVAAVAPAPAPEPVAAPVAAVAASAAPTTPSNVAPISGEAAPAASGAAPAAAPEKSTKDKEQELLSEFEKMLAS